MRSSGRLPQLALAGLCHLRAEWQGESDESAMINELHVRNFKCLRDTQIAFEPLTVLIGPNDSGKTSILEVLQLLGEMAIRRPSDIFQGARAVGNLTWRRDPQFAPSWEARGAVLSSSRERFIYKMALDPSGRIADDSFEGRFKLIRHSGKPYIPGVDPPMAAEPDEAGVHYAMRTHVARDFKAVVDAFSASFIYHLDPRALRKPATPREQQTLAPGGENLSAILDSLLSGPDRRAVFDMEEALRQAVPTLQGFSTPPAPQGTVGEKTIQFALTGNEKRPITIPCELASDGAMLITAFLALAYGDTPEVLLIEEPENGLHPARLKEVIELLRKMTRGEVGNKPRQVILTTHSPLLLNYADPAEVRIVRRDPEQGTQVTPLKQVAGIDELLKEFGVGELWYLLGEQGLVEGKKP